MATQRPLVGRGERGADFVARRGDGQATRFYAYVGGAPAVLAFAAGDGAVLLPQLTDLRRSRLLHLARERPRTHTRHVRLGDPDDLVDAALERQVEGTFTRKAGSARSPDRRIGASLDENTHDRRVSANYRKHERRQVVFGRVIQIGAARREQPDDVHPGSNEESMSTCVVRGWPVP